MERTTRTDEKTGSYGTTFTIINRVLVISHPVPHR